MKNFCNRITIVTLLLLTTMVTAQKSKARGQYISLTRSNVMFKGDKDGFDFDKLLLKYQFVNCDGKVMLGVTYDKKAHFTRYWKDGVAYSKQTIKNVKWPKPEQIILDKITANMYFGGRKLGRVKIFGIPEFYQGCAGRMYDALYEVGIDPKQGVYKSNINKLFLADVKVVEASVGR